MCQIIFRRDQECGGSVHRVLEPAFDLHHQGVIALPQPVAPFAIVPPQLPNPVQTDLLARNTSRGQVAAPRWNQPPVNSGPE